MKSWIIDVSKRFWANLKRAHTSWTIWFNAVVWPILANYWPQIWDALPQFQAYLPANKYQSLFTIGLVINIILRFKTDNALKDK